MPLVQQPDGTYLNVGTTTIEGKEVFGNLKNMGTDQSYEPSGTITKQLLGNIGSQPINKPIKKSAYEETYGKQPDWVGAGPPPGYEGDFYMSPQVLTELINPVTGEKWTAPSGGYWVKPDLDQYGRPVTTQDPLNSISTTPTRAELIKGSFDNIDLSSNAGMPIFGGPDGNKIVGRYDNYGMPMMGPRPNPFAGPPTIVNSDQLNNPGLSNPNYQYVVYDGKNPFQRPANPFARQEEEQEGIATLSPFRRKR